MGAAKAPAQRLLTGRSPLFHRHTTIAECESPVRKQQGISEALVIAVREGVLLGSSSGTLALSTLSAEPMSQVAGGGRACRGSSRTPPLCPRLSRAWKHWGDRPHAMGIRTSGLTVLPPCALLPFPGSLALGVTSALMWSLAPAVPAMDSRQPQASW